MSSFDAVNDAEWAAGVSSALADLEIEAEEDLRALGREITKNMRDAAPTMDAQERARRLEADPPTATRKPSKATIRSVPGRDAKGFYVDVGPSRGAFYLRFIEYGTSKMAARPFLRPAIEKAIARRGGAR